MLSRRQFLLKAGLVALTATGCTKIKLPVPAVDPPPPVPAAEQGPRPYRVALLSDPHVEEFSSITAAGINGKLARAVADLDPLKIDLWLTCGDVTNHGKRDQFDAFKQIFRSVAKPEQLIVTTGNHEFYDQQASDEEAMRHFTKAFGLAHPYNNRVAGEIHFVMLADEQYDTAPYNREWAWLSKEQLRWFEQVLAEHKDKFTVVCLHQPLQETVGWSHGGNDFAGSGQVKELRAILKANPQVKLWLSGHTHLRLEHAGQVVRQNGVTFMALGSTFYQFMPSDKPGDGGYRKDLDASQSRVMEVWPDRVVIRARDHAVPAWMDDLEVTLKR